jgi:uncharacterized membrane protein HdeD (DUF308 family)
MNGYEDVRRNSGWFIALGAALIVLGMIALWAAAGTTLFSVILFGWLLFFGGIFQTVHAFRVRPWSGLVLQFLIGILNIVVGILMVANPTAGAAGLTLLLASFFIVGGAFRIALGARQQFPGRGWAIFTGMVNILLGLLIWAHWPASSLWVIGLFVGVDLIFTGWWFALLGTTARRLASATD